MDFEKQQQAFRTSSPSLIGRGFEKITSPVGGAVAAFVPNGLVRGVLQGIDRAVGTPQLVKFDHDLAVPLDSGDRIDHDGLAGGHGHRSPFTRSG